MTRPPAEGDVSSYRMTASVTDKYGKLIEVGRTDTETVLIPPPGIGALFFEMTEEEFAEFRRQWEAHSGGAWPTAAPAPAADIELHAIIAERNQLRYGLVRAIVHLEESAAATEPSKKSAIEVAVAGRLRALLDQAAGLHDSDGQPMSAQGQPPTSVYVTRDADGNWVPAELLSNTPSAPVTAPGQAAGNDLFALAAFAAYHGMTGSDDIPAAWAAQSGRSRASWRASADAVIAVVDALDVAIGTGAAVMSAPINPELPHCGARWPNRGPAGGRWICSIDRGHDGDHEAWGPGGPGTAKLFSSAPQDDDEITWDACPDCKDTGLIDIDQCNCAVGPSGYYGMHERYCGTEMCPNGCWDELHPQEPQS